MTNIQQGLLVFIYILWFFFVLFFFLEKLAASVTVSGEHHNINTKKKLHKTKEAENLVGRLHS